MEGKKISFGFMKTKKADKSIVEDKKEFIECVEEQSIKVIGGEEVKENVPLIIPMKPNTLVTAERLKQIAEKVESALEEPEAMDEHLKTEEKLPENETLDQMAVRELLQEAEKEVKVETQVLAVPLPAKPVNEGEKESTLDDYESVPIQDFGLAMLRGMGWQPSKEMSKYKQPQLRPKGLGLGADKVVKDNQKQKSTKDGKEEELTIVKNAYVKITTGKYSGYYGKIMSLDEDNGRVMVDIAVKKEMVSLSEFMMHPVTKSEFDRESKVINAGSYDEYKKKESMQKSSKHTEIQSTSKSTDRSYKEEKPKYSEREGKSSKNTDSTNYNEESSRSTEKDASSSKNNNGKSYKDNDDRRERDRDRSNRDRKRDPSEERHKKKNSKRYSSSESLSSLSDTERKRSDHRSKNKPEGKRDIDKKRKGKKKKRDRDRSPNYRKHRK